MLLIDPERYFLIEIIMFIKNQGMFIIITAMIMIIIIELIFLNR